MISTKKAEKGNAKNVVVVGIGQDITTRWSQEKEDSKLSLGETLEFYAIKLEEESTSGCY